MAPTEKEDDLLKALLKRAINYVLGHFGLRVYSVYAHGRDDMQDILCAGIDMNVIIDVGANVGQSIFKFRSTFSSAQIYSFEPVESVFEKLSENIRQMDGVQVFRRALGSTPGVASIHVRIHDTTHTLLAVDDAISVELVEVDTVDQFCGAHQISHVDLLKVDVEGFDLEVLRGAESMLQRGEVRFILVECGFTPGDARHVLFDVIRDYLHPFGYRLFGIYDQQLEWSGEPRIRFANVCFSLQAENERFRLHPG